MRRIYFIVTILVCIVTGSYGQAISTIRSLTIGDKVPPEFFSTILQKRDGSTVQLTQLLKGRYLIIDFFATWCIPCVKALPEIQDYQQSYGDKLLILPVTTEPSTTVRSFLTRQPSSYNSLEFISDDYILTKYFPHRMVPHEVWINANGIVVAITEGKVLTRPLLDNFIAGKPIDAALKKDDLRLDLLQPLFIDGNGGSDNDYSYRSIAGGHIPGAQSSTKIFREGSKVSKLVATNTTALNLFTSAFSEFKLYNYNWHYIIANVRDSSRLTYKPGPLTNAWRNQNYTTYELSFKKPVADSLFFSYMMQDLNRILDLRCEIKQKNMLCYIISRKDPNDSTLKTRTKDVSGPFTGKMRNLPFQRFIEHLCNYKNCPPFIDESGIDFNVDIDLDFALDLRYPLEMEKLEHTLNKYGLSLKQEERVINVMYITDKPES